MLLQEIYQTEIQARKAIGIFDYFEGYYTYQSPQFPTYWMGNGIEILTSRDRNFKDWQRLFELHFDSQKFKHRVFTFLENPDLDFLKKMASEATYEVIDSPMMFASKIPKLTPLAKSWEIKEIKTSKDFANFRYFKTLTNPENEWFAKEGFDKSRVKDDFLKTKWYGIVPKGGEEILSAMGIFQHNDIARLQEVDTHPDYRRRGFASQLLKYVLDLGIRQWGCKGVSLFSETSDPAVGLYHKVGFETIGYHVELLKAPE